MGIVLGFPPSTESVAANMRQFSIFVSVNVTVPENMNESMIDSAYLHALNDCDDYETEIPTDLQKLIEEENEPTCKIIKDTLTINLGDENDP